MILCGYNVDTLNICMKEFIIFVCTSSTEIFLSELSFCSVCYNLSEIFSFHSLNMDYVITNSADPDEMTRCVAFHLGLPCSIKHPIRGFWYTKGIHLLYLGTKVAMFYNGSNSL